MNWTKTIPTRPGAYWRKIYPVELASPMLLELYESKGELLAIGNCVHGLASSLCGEWCGPLVPVEEVRRAYYEGHIHAISSDPEADPQELSWPNSRARRVVEGKEI